MLIWLAVIPAKAGHDMCEANPSGITSKIISEFNLQQDVEIKQKHGFPPSRE